jgi:hypothetical protein
LVEMVTESPVVFGNAFDRAPQRARNRDAGTLGGGAGVAAPATQAERA